jgi:hypothetical protein
VHDFHDESLEPDCSFEVAKNGCFLKTLNVLDQSELNEVNPYLRSSNSLLFFIGTYFGELNVYKFEDLRFELVKQWKFRSPITSVVAFDFKNDRLQQIAKLFEHQGHNEKTINL